MEEQEKNELDTRITGDLTSNHHHIMDLEKQFKEILGYAIPCRESYLHSVPYRLMVNDSGYNTEINVVAPSPLLPLLSPKTETPHTKGSYFAEVHSSPTNNCCSGVISKNSKQLRVTNYIENRLKEIIKKHPEGLHCNRLPDLYKDHFGQDLNIFNYGYKSVAHLCIDLSSIFTYQNLSDSSVKVFDKDLEVEVHHEPIQSLKMVRDRPSRNTELALPDGVEDTLLDFHLEHLAQDIAANIGIIRQWIGPEIEVESYINIVVGEVYDPSKFWIQLWERWHSLNQLMDCMQVFYRNNKGKYSIPCYAIKEGMYLACILDGEYHRAKVIDDTKKKKDGTLKVYYIDYGTVAVIQTQGVCYLVQDFVKLPAQAIRARLWGIQPTVRDMPWPSATSLRFFEVVRSKVLVGQVYAVDEEEMIVDLIILETTSPNRDSSINNVLVYEDLAAFIDEETKEPKSCEWEPTVEDVYLYPKHEEFETGVVPTYQAMLHMLASNFSYDIIFPRYFQAKSVNTPRPSAEVHGTEANNHFSKQASQAGKISGKVTMQAPFQKKATPK